jgi:hypothetical protein
MHLARTQPFSFKRSYPPKEWGRRYRDPGQQLRLRYLSTDELKGIQLKQDVPSWLCEELRRQML